MLGLAELRKRFISKFPFEANSVTVEDCLLRVHLPYNHFMKLIELLSKEKNDYVI